MDYEKLSRDRPGETSEIIRQRVQAAQDIQRERFEIGNLPTSEKQSQETLRQAQGKTLQSVICNADMRVKEVRQFCQLDEQGQSLMWAAMNQLNLSARGYHRILKLARTIADLAGSDQIQAAHLAEALQYRPKVLL